MKKKAGGIVLITKTKEPRVSGWKSQRPTHRVDCITEEMRQFIRMQTGCFLFMKGDSGPNVELVPFRLKSFPCPKTLFVSVKTTLLLERVTEPVEAGLLFIDFVRNVRLRMNGTIEIGERSPDGCYRLVIRLA